MGRIRGKASILRARARKEKAENQEQERDVQRLAKMNEEQAREYVRKQRIAERRKPGSLTW